MPFFGIGIKTELFQSCGHCWIFRNKNKFSLENLFWIVYVSSILWVYMGCHRTLTDICHIFIWEIYVMWTLGVMTNQRLYPKWGVIKEWRFRVDNFLIFQDKLEIWIVIWNLSMFDTGWNFFLNTLILTSRPCYDLNFWPL